MRRHLSLCLLWGVVQASQAGVAIGSFPIPVHVENASTGIFVELTREIALRTDTEVRLHVVPARRAVDNFVNRSFAGLVPALDTSFEPGQKWFRTSEAIDCKEDFIFTLKDKPLLRTLADLQGKRVGITRGYPYAREVTEHSGFLLETAASDQANIMKLLTGRLDAFVLDEKTGVRAFERMNALEKMQYPADSPVSRQDVYYGFQATPEGRELADSFSAALRDMKADGRYQAITRGVTFANGCAR